MKNQICYIGKASHTTGNIDIKVENGTMFATASSLNTIITNNYLGLKESVPSFHWTQRLVEKHSHSIQNQLQCQGLAVQEGWHYTVFNSELKECYFGMMNILEGISIDDDSPRQVSINTAELSSFKADTFVTRSSNLYYHYTYVRYVYPKNEEHCSIHCVFDLEDKCDFFFVVHSYCYLGNFNQPSYAYHLTDTVTTYIYQGKIQGSPPKIRHWGLYQS